MCLSTGDFLKSCGGFERCETLGIVTIVLEECFAWTMVAPLI